MRSAGRSVSKALEIARGDLEVLLTMPNRRGRARRSGWLRRPLPRRSSCFGVVRSVLLRSRNIVVCGEKRRMREARFLSGK